MEQSGGSPEGKSEDPEWAVMDTAEAARGAIGRGKSGVEDGGLRCYARRGQFGVVNVQQLRPFVATAQKIVAYMKIAVLYRLHQRCGMGVGMTHLQQAE